MKIATTGLDQETLELTLKAFKDYIAEKVSDHDLLGFDTRDEFPTEIVRGIGSDLGIQLLFVPEAYGGMGGDAVDIYRICEAMARVDLGVATGVLATFLGSDPVLAGGTETQKQKWLSMIANDGVLYAYGATEAEAGSDLASLRTTATPVEENGKVVGYKINGNKQWISNGGVADVYTVLANTPGGPSWFIVEKGAEGFSYGKQEDKHGIRASNTAALSLEDVFVPVENMVGEAEGQGLIQAQAVFGYTRLMVAAFGLGGGWAALDRAIPYSTERIQAGGPLSEKQGYTHKLIIPHVVHLEAARAYIEATAARLTAGETNLNTEGAIAKYLATEAGNIAADASIQALGGYGYTREYMVEKYKRDVRITTIYEGTSEIMEMTISRDRWQMHLKTRGQHYHEKAAQMEALHRTQSSIGANIAALALHALAEVLERARIARLTRFQHILLRLGELIAVAEGAEAMVKRAAAAAQGNLNPKFDRRFHAPDLAAISRINARETALKVAQDGLKWIGGGAAMTDAEYSSFETALNLSAIYRSQQGIITDMDYVADVLYDRAQSGA
ncbi:MAG: acyl-CoA dehydrogenase family protein [Blastocatellia bacterium]|nr:acyl-CoA dehydrogenase family protein [Blastocatellia bacterium]